MSVLIFISLFFMNTIIKPNECTIKHITDPKWNYTISGDHVLFRSFIGDIRLKIPDNILNQIAHNSTKNTTNERGDRYRRNILGPYVYQSIFRFPDFFECIEQAQMAISPYSENHRNWEAFFKRNSINDTISVRYCCNLIEYINTAEQTLSYDCRYQIRLQEQVMVRSEIRITCRQFEFENIQCFLVRWMYWWIPLLLILLIALGIFFVCVSLRSRRNKSQL